MSGNPLKRLGTLGQSIWLDYIRRDLMASGELRRLIDEDGLRGMTSNPSIFEKAIADSHDYDGDIRAMALGGNGADAIYETLSQRDVESAADQFRPLYDRTDGQDGYVSLEVNPHLAHDTKGTIEEARRLWAALNRPNVLIKVPATANGLPAIQQLIGEGISVNVTLLFGLPRYRQVVEAYLAGVEARAAQGKPVKHLASVASFFVSRIDALVDPLLEKIMARGGKEADLARAARGQTAIASAKMAYRIYQEIFGSDRFKKLAADRKKAWHEAARRRTSRKRRAAKLPSPAPRWPIESTRRSSAATGSKSWLLKAPVPSGCSGPAPAPRTRTTATSNTSRPSSDRTRSTRRRWKPWMPTATMESRKPGSNRMSRKPAGCWRDCRNSASASTM